jgi:hypothetical protein
VGWNKLVILPGQIIVFKYIKTQDGKVILSHLLKKAPVISTHFMKIKLPKENKLISPTGSHLRGKITDSSTVSNQQPATSNQ